MHRNDTACAGPPYGPSMAGRVCATIRCDASVRSLLEVKRQVCPSDVNDPIRHPDTSNVLVFGQTNVLLAESARCGSRSWQRVPWEVISAGGLPRRGNAWGFFGRGGRGAPLAPRG